MKEQDNPPKPSGPVVSSKNEGTLEAHTPVEVEEGRQKAFKRVQPSSFYKSKQLNNLQRGETRPVEEEQTVKEGHQESPGAKKANLTSTKLYIVTSEENEGQTTAFQSLRQDCSWVSALIVVAFIIIPLSLIAYFASNAGRIYEFVLSLEDWFEENKLKGFFAFASLYLAWVPLVLPSSIMTISGGILFSMCFGGVGGYFLCTLAIAIGHPIGMTISFMIGRYFMKACVRKHLVHKVRLFTSIDKAVKQQSIKLMMLLRVQILIPWNTLNYIVAVTSIDYKEFIIGSTIGIAPGTLAMLFVGVNISNITELLQGKRKLTVIEWMILTVGSVCVFVVMKYLGGESRRQLARILDAQQTDVEDGIELAERTRKASQKADSKDAHNGLSLKAVSLPLEKDRSETKQADPDIEAQRGSASDQGGLEIAHAQRELEKFETSQSCSPRGSRRSPQVRGGLHFDHVEPSSPVEIYEINYEKVTTPVQIPAKTSRSLQSEEQAKKEEKVQLEAGRLEKRQLEAEVMPDDIFSEDLESIPSIDPDCQNE